MQIRVTNIICLLNNKVGDNAFTKKSSSKMKLYWFIFFLYINKIKVFYSKKWSMFSIICFYAGDEDQISNYLISVIFNSLTSATKSSLYPLIKFKINLISHA